MILTEEKTIYSLLRKGAENFSDVDALVSKEENHSHADLYGEVLSLAKAYQKAGLSGKKVDLLPHLSVEWIVVCLALMTAGVTVVLHEPLLKVEDYIDDLALQTTAEELYAWDRPVGADFIPPKEEDTAILIFTSGTSGRPKGVRISHKNIISDARLGTNRIGRGALEAGHKTIPMLPLFHLFGLTGAIIAPLSLGMTLYIIPEMKYVLKSLPVIRPRILFIVPMIAKTILGKAAMLEKKGLTPKAIKEQALGGVDMLVCGGAPLQKEMITAFARYEVDLLNGYGITECSPIVTCSEYRNHVAGSVGNVKKLPETEVEIIDGTVHVSGDIVMQGYYKYTANPFKEVDGKIWLDTQDNGFIDSAGNLFITGRQSNLIILDDGNNIAPEELEFLFDPYPLVKAVMVHEGEAAGQKIVTAAVYPDPDLAAGLSPEDLQEKIEAIVREVNTSLPMYKQIKQCRVRQRDFKRTSLRKIIRTEINL